MRLKLLSSSATHSRHPPGQGWCPKQPSSNVSGLTWGWANTTAEHPWPDDQPEHANPSTSSTTTATASQLSTNLVSVLSMNRLPFWRVFNSFYIFHKIVQIFFIKVIPRKFRIQFPDKLKVKVVNIVKNSKFDLNFLVVPYLDQCRSLIKRELTFKKIIANFVFEF